MTFSRSLTKKTQDSDETENQLQLLKEKGDLDKLYEHYIEQILSLHN